MDKIWDRKSFEVGGHWPLWRGWKKRMTMQNRQKSNAKFKKKKIGCIRLLFTHICALPIFVPYPYLCLTHICALPIFVPYPYLCLTCIFELQNSSSVIFLSLSIRPAWCIPIPNARVSFTFVSFTPVIMFSIWNIE